MPRNNSCDDRDWPECDSCGDTDEMVTLCPNCGLNLCSRCYGNESYEICRECRHAEEDARAARRAVKETKANA